MNAKEVDSESYAPTGLASGREADRAAMNATGVVTEHVMSSEQSTEASTVSAPVRNRPSRLLPAMYYWVLSRL